MASGLVCIYCQQLQGNDVQNFILLTLKYNVLYKINGDALPFICKLYFEAQNHLLMMQLLNKTDTKLSFMRL